MTIRVDRRDLDGVTQVRSIMGNDLNTIADVAAAAIEIVNVDVVVVAGVVPITIHISLVGTVIIIVVVIVELAVDIIIIVVVAAAPTTTPLRFGV